MRWIKPVEPKASSDTSAGSVRARDYVRFFEQTRGRTVSWLVMAGCLLFAVTAWYLTRDETNRRIQQQFDFRARRIEADIRSRLLTYQHMLRGGIGMFMGSDTVTREEWKIYVEALHINQHYPGVQGLGFAKYLLPEQKDHFVASIRADGFPDFSISPDGERPEYTAIVFLEPFDWRNRRAFGYDMFSDPVRREAMVRARDSGQVALSGKVTLMQESGQDMQPGFLIYIPLYHRSSAPVTVEQRRAALDGYVYSPFRMIDFMNGVLAEDREYVELQIFDGDTADASALLYQGNYNPDRHPVFIHQSVFEFGGHHWLLIFSSSGYFEKNVDLKKANVILLLGVLISLLLSNMIFFLNKSRRQAAALADMADGLDLANRRLRDEMRSREKAESELNNRAQEIDDFNAAMIGRESRVIELKEEVNRLCRELGKEPVYPPVWAEDTDKSGSGR